MGMDYKVNEFGEIVRKKRGLYQIIGKYFIICIGVLITLYAILWGTGYISRCRYDYVRGTSHYYPHLSGFNGYMEISDKGLYGLVECYSILGVDIYMEKLPCVYKGIVLSKLESYKEDAWGYHPSQLPVLVRGNNDKLAIASVEGVFYTDFIYDKIGYDSRGLFCAVFDSESEYESQLSMFIAPALENTKWGFVDNRGNALTPAIYDEIEPFYDGFNAKARIGRKWYTITANSLAKSN